MVLAGPPFVTDDPEPTDLGHWEIYNFVSWGQIKSVGAGRAGFDVNRGAAPNLQLTVVVPISFQTGAEPGLGDIELAAKYKFLHQAKGAWTPDIAFFPRIFAPTARRGLGNGRVALWLPVWVQKDFGPWSVFGGGGYEFQPGPGARDNWQTGLGVTRTLSKRLTLGAEVYSQSAATRTSPAYAGVNLGALYKITDHWAFIASAGPGIEHSRPGEAYDAYIALEAAY
jgi:hypothetical protein